MLEHRVLIVEDEIEWQKTFLRGIERLNYTPQVASSYEEADVTLDRHHFHLVLIDLELEKGSEILEGKKLVQKIDKSDEGTSIMIISVFADAEIATEAVKKYNVFYVIEKHKLTPQKLTELAKEAVLEAEERYRTTFVSAIEYLRGNQDLYPWVAKVLQAVLATETSNLHDFSQLRDFLNELLANLYPLLYHRLDKGAIVDGEVGVVSARCWSRALGEPILVKFGRQELIDQEVEDVDRRPEVLVQGGFARRERVHRVSDLGGIVYVLADTPFEDFERRKP